LIPALLFAVALVGGTAAATGASLLSVDSLVSLLTLTALEVVLGIDNVVFIAILVGKLPISKQDRARRLGLGLAMGIRILLLLAVGWIMGLTEPLFSLPKFWTGEMGDLHGISGRDLILLVGGLFLIGKATFEIHDKLEGDDHRHGGSGAPTRRAPSFGAILGQILILDIVFSLDSVITAVGMAQRIEVMIAAVVIAVGVMLVFAGRVSSFVERHPTMKMLALSFLLLIGVMLVVDALHGHIPKGYIYFSMAFSLAVELLNLKMRKRQAPVTLHQSYVEPPAGASPSGYRVSGSDMAS
jgi:predicted tellurium resistance membrane protein TerC